MGTVEIKKEAVEYRRIADGTDLIATEADHYLAIAPVMCTVLKHRVTTSVEYLVELPNGERRWVGTNEDC